jgi:hypothetical protein
VARRLDHLFAADCPGYQADPACGHDFHERAGQHRSLCDEAQWIHVINVYCLAAEGA